MRITKVKKGSIDLSMRIFCVVIMFESLEIAAKIVKISKKLLFYRYLAPKLLHQFAKGKMPHPDGDIEVQFSKSGETGLTGTIILPKKTSGTLEWNGKIVALRDGKQEIKVE